MSDEVHVEVRDAQPGDAAAVRAVHLAAFPSAVEADLVEQLQRNGDAVLSMMAVDRASPSTTAFGRGPPPRAGEECIVGHILMSRMTAEGDGRDYRAVGLAPVAVLPDRQNMGIGGRLVRAAVDRMREQGEELVFLVGEPDYYRRFGFEAETAAPFASPYAGPYFMALALNGAEVPAAGRADYAPAFAGLE